MKKQKRKKNFTLRYPNEINKIVAYEISSDEDLFKQSIRQPICEVCLFKNPCYMGDCIASQEWIESMRYTFLHNIIEYRISNKQTLSLIVF